MHSACKFFSLQMLVGVSKGTEESPIVIDDSDSEEEDPEEEEESEEEEEEEDDMVRCDVSDENVSVSSIYFQCKPTMFY